MNDQLVHLNTVKHDKAANTNSAARQKKKRKKLFRKLRVAPGLPQSGGEEKDIYNMSEVLHTSRFFPI